MIEGIIIVALGVTLSVGLIVHRVALAKIAWAVIKVAFAILLFGALGLLASKT